MSEAHRQRGGSGRRSAPGPVMRPIYVSVCGPSKASDDEMSAAEEIGRLLAEAGAVIVTGGLDGVMEGAARGARAAGGTTVGILPGANHDDGNDFNMIVIPTGMGEMRNALVVRAAEVVIAVGGEFGTLSEIALALRLRKPVVAYKTWELAREGLDIPVVQADSPADAVRLALEAARR